MDTGLRNLRPTVPFEIVANQKTGKRLHKDDCPMAVDWVTLSRRKKMW